MFLLLLYVFFGIVLKKLSESDMVIPTEAGPTDHVNVPPPYKTKSICPKINGQYLDMSRYIRTVVCGYCMQPKKIYNGDNVLVKKIDTTKDLMSQIKKEDILFLYVSEKNIYKFRVLDRIGEDGALYTKYYDANGQEKHSSRPHTQQMVLGIARYKL